MTDYISKIADLINGGKNVILYSVGGDTLNILRALKIRYNLLPAALCDKDERKQHKTFVGLYDMIPLSPSEAKQKYENAYWFISTLEYKFQIIGELMDNLNVSSENIINFEPVIKRKSCEYIEKSLVCDEHERFSFCWYQPPELPAIDFNGSYEDSFSAFRLLRDKTIEHYNNECGDCCFYKEDYYPADRKIRWINYGVGGVCNFDCIYCRSNARTAKGIDNNLPKLDRIISCLENSDMLAEDYGINIAPGEPTVHPEKEKLFGAMGCYSNVINTNGVMFYEPLYNLMRDKFTKMVVSIDSGTRETFLKVKGRDSFDKVCANLKKYSSAGSGIIVLKYVFIPGINDSEDDVKGFVKTCMDTGCLIGNISYDYNSPIPIPEKTVSAMKLLRSELQKNNILCTSNIIYSASDYVSELKKV